MKLRSLKLVHFRGLSQVQAKDLPSEGVVRVPVEDGAGCGTLAEIVRFATLGEAPESGPAVTDGQGYAYVELGFRLPEDPQASLFRGVDRRGSDQVSLREEGGLRVTGGGDAVRERLHELLGDDLEGWCRAACVTRVPTDEAAVAALLDASRTEVGADVPALPQATDDALVGLQRSLRAERLRRLALARNADLVEEGRRLRRTRAATAHAVDEAGAERDRVRTRLRRLNEYRDLVARGESNERVAQPPTERRRGFAIEWGLATCASLLLLCLVLYSTSPSGGEDQRAIQVGLGLGFLVAAASYLGVATRRHSGGRGRFVVVPADDDQRAVQAPDNERWRDELRRRFADVGEIDDPALASSLRARLSELDGELGPLHARLEELDDALTVHDVEVGRATRSLHAPRPEPEAGPDGLPDGATVRESLKRSKDLGDGVYGATVERDALLADGAREPEEATAEASRAVRAACEEAGRPGESDALVARITAWEDVVEAAGGVDGVSPEDELVESVRDDLSAVVVGAERSTASALDVSTVTGGALAALHVRDGAIFAERPDGDELPWAELEPSERSAVGVAAAVSASAPGDDISRPPRFVAIDNVPDGVDDDALLQAVRGVRPDVAQVVVAGPADPRDDEPQDAAPRARLRRRPRGRR